MAIFAATDYAITFNGTAVTDHCSAVSLDIDVDDLDSTVFGVSWKSHLGGLKGATFGMTLKDDFAASSMDSLIWSALGTSVAVTVKPTSASNGTSNPQYQFNVLVTQQRIGGQVGAIAEKQLSFPVTGTVTRATS